MAYIYILQSLVNSRYYIGSTNNITRRLNEHRLGKSKYTKTIIPVKLVFSQTFESLRLARKVEYWIKRQKDRAFIEKVIKDGDITKRFPKQSDMV